MYPFILKLTHNLKKGGWKSEHGFLPMKTLVWPFSSNNSEERDEVTTAQSNREKKKTLQHNYSYIFWS